MKTYVIEMSNILLFFTIWYLWVVIIVSLENKKSFFKSFNLYKELKHANSFEKTVLIFIFGIIFSVLFTFLLSCLFKSLHSFNIEIIW